MSEHTHRWNYLAEVLDTNPPIRMRTCKSCGVVQQTGLDSKWHINWHETYHVRKMLYPNIVSIYREGIDYEFRGGK